MLFAAGQPDYVTSDDLNARAARFERTIDGLNETVNDLRRQVELNSNAIAEQRGREKVWGIVLSLLTSGSIALHFTGRKKNGSDSK
jgi:hypothetical protein